MALREHVSAIDELKMATIRLRIRHPDEPRTNRTEVNILEPTEVLSVSILLYIMINQL